MASGRKIQRNQPITTSAPQTRMFQPRPFAAPAQSEMVSPQAQQTPEVQAKLESQPTGDRLSRVDFSATTPIQPKLTIGAPGDKYEQEADTVARKVVQQIHAPTSPDASPVQRKIVPTPVVQAQSFHSAIMPKLTIQRQDEEAAPDLESSISRAKSSGSPLDNVIRPKMEGAFGADFSGVRVHTDASSDMLSRSISARAFTTGQHIFFKKGEYNPGSSGGQELLAHELTHVVQQSGKRGKEKESQAIQKKPTEKEKEIKTFAIDLKKMDDLCGKKDLEASCEAVRYLYQVAEKVKNESPISTKFFTQELSLPSALEKKANAEASWDTEEQKLAQLSYQIYCLNQAREAAREWQRVAKAYQETEAKVRKEDTYGNENKLWNKNWERDSICRAVQANVKEINRIYEKKW